MNKPHNTIFKLRSTSTITIPKWCLDLIGKDTEVFQLSVNANEKTITYRPFDGD